MNNDDGFPYSEDCVCPSCCRLRRGETRTLRCAAPAAKTSSIYIIGSMRNPRVPLVAKALRELGYDAFDDWYSSGPEADDRWQEYEKARGRSFAEALDGYHAKHVFELDLFHLDRCAAAVLVAPAGKSAHTELGYMRGSKKPTFYLLEGEPERFDIMIRFASGGVFTALDALKTRLLEVLP